LPLPPRHSPNRRTGSPPIRIRRPLRLSQATRPIHLPRTRTLRSRDRAAGPRTRLQAEQASCGLNCRACQPHHHIAGPRERREPLGGPDHTFAAAVIAAVRQSAAGELNQAQQAPAADETDAGWQRRRARI
jgi:hypothetical protein